MVTVMLPIFGGKLGAVILLNLCVVGCSVKITYLAVCDQGIFFIGDFCLLEGNCIVCHFCV